MQHLGLLKMHVKHQCFFKVDGCANITANCSDPFIIIIKHFSKLNLRKNETKFINKCVPNILVMNVLQGDYKGSVNDVIK